MLLLIDGHAIIYRAYHAFPELTDPQGRLVNAVYGFARILLTAIRDFEPEYIAVAFDHPKPTFRHEQFADYKAQRAEMPDDLKPQVERIKQLVEVLNIPMLEQAGFEADDLIGSFAGQVAAKNSDLQVVIVTGDKDLLQLVTEQVHVWIPSRGKYGTDTEYDPDGVKQKMGVPPEKVVDLKGLMGDSSDNIPGVKGVGQKTALKLLQQFGSLEAVFERVDKLASGELEKDPLIKGALFKRLHQDKDQAFMSRELAKIDVEAKFSAKLEDCRLSGYKKDEAAMMFDELGFRSLVKLLPADDFELGVQSALF
jgi:DNA polymerase-1